jgi:hypothetical protein
VFALHAFPNDMGLPESWLGHAIANLCGRAASSEVSFIITLPMRRQALFMDVLFFKLLRPDLFGH